MKKISFALLIPIILFAGCAGTKSSNNDNPLGFKGSDFYSPNKIPHVLLNKSLEVESQIGWISGNHTSSPVPIGSAGPQKYVSKLKGIIPNTRIGEIIKEAIKDSVNVILVIGDGMGINQMSLPIYMNIAEGKSEPTYFEKIMNEGEAGFVLTNTYNGLITCSAAAGTAIATGNKTRLNIVGCDSEGNAVENVLEYAESNNYSTGLVTDASITDATPAAFYSHEVNRNNESGIASQLILNNDIDVIFGGGASFFIPKGNTLKDEPLFFDFDDIRNSASSRDDTLNLISEFRKRDYKIINTKAELLNTSNTGNKVVGLFAGGGISAAIDRDDENTQEPSLVEMAKKNLEILTGKGNNYFTMIECGRIDWEAHDNDAGAVYKAVEEMNYVLETCYQYYLKDKNNTLLIFTADHETGGLAISHLKYPNKKIEKERLASGKEWENDTSPLIFSDFIKLKEQKMSLYKIFEHISTFDDFYKTVNDNMGYQISKADAEEIYKYLINYRKSKY